MLKAGLEVDRRQVSVSCPTCHKIKLFTYPLRKINFALTDTFFFTLRLYFWRKKPTTEEENKKESDSIDYLSNLIGRDLKSTKWFQVVLAFFFLLR